MTELATVLHGGVARCHSPIRQANGRRRKRPAKVHADKAYDSRRCRHALSARHIKVRIARQGIEPKDRLGRHRWVVERTIAWSTASDG